MPEIGQAVRFFGIAPTPADLEARGAASPALAAIIVGWDVETGNPNVQVFDPTGTGTQWIGDLRRDDGRTSPCWAPILSEQ